MECLVRGGGELADGCRVWRDMTRWAEGDELDVQASQSVHAMKFFFNEGTR